jgi:hypothetical protein
MVQGNAGIRVPRIVFFGEGGRNVLPRQDRGKESALPHEEIHILRRRVAERHVAARTIDEAGSGGGFSQRWSWLHRVKR